MQEQEFHEGCRFGHLVVTGKENHEKGGLRRYECVCDCGNKTWVTKHKLLTGHTKSCGCMTTRKSRFDLLSLIPYIDSKYPEEKELIESGKARMNDKIHCLCKVCGEPLKIKAIKHFFDHLDNFCTCPRCIQKKVSKGGKKGTKQNPEHRGLKRDYPRLYTIWKLMHKRCEDETNNMYYLYGGRGVKVCEDWTSLKSFIDWANKNGYSDDLTIDRVDSNKNYSPENCRWVTRTIQNRNKRATKYINGIDSNTFFEQTPHDPSVSYIRFFMRYFKSGWSLEDSLNRPNLGRIGLYKKDGTKVLRKQKLLSQDNEELNKN